LEGPPSVTTRAGWSCTDGRNAPARQGELARWFETPTPLYATGMAEPPRDPEDDKATARAAGKYAPAATAAATFRLTATEGPDRGKAMTIDGTEPSAALVGQSPACELQLVDRQVSRRHVALDLVDGRLRLLDLESTNGTTVNGVAVTAAFLRGGELVRIGETALRVELVSPNTIVPLSNAECFGRVIGASAEMRRLYPLCERLAASDVSVIIEGETGTGKELLAESLHEEGPRRGGPFVVFDCTAVPANLVESDLFGHERGAFTGAVQGRKGVFEQAHGGTLLIDEIGDLEPSLQPKLLRALERSEVRRVGGDRPIKVDVRILCATRRDLDREVQAGRFRDDLYHRLAVARIEMPPLRRRRGDIVRLARALARTFGSNENALPEPLLVRWEDYAWPGNVRELRNSVLRHLALGDLADETGASSLPPMAPHGSAEGALERILGLTLPFSMARERVLAEFERGYVERLLQAHGGNVMRAAAASGIARRHLQRVRARTLKPSA
jgi:two-component system response regulator HydG